MKRFLIVALSASPPGTMGGNTKIAIEMARHMPSLGWRVVVVVPSGKLLTFTDNVSAADGLQFREIADFEGDCFLRPFASARHYTREFEKAFDDLDVCGDDVVFAVCNFHYEIVPLVRLKRRYGYTYLPSHFLFSPFIIENLAKGYRFPALKYLILWFYEHFFFLMAKRVADGFVITNDSDLCHFPRTMRPRVFAFYGGVNVDQIPKSIETKTRDVVFCGRLHPQKGIYGLLEIWAIVVSQVPHARLTVIGNGDPRYERILRTKAHALGLDDRIEWLGYVNNEAKYAIYRLAKVFAHSTIFDNNGMVAAEALCSGLPVVMYDIPSLRKVYRDGCIKVPYGNKDAYATELVRLILDDEWRATIAPDACKIQELRSFWNWNSRVKAFSDFLRNHFEVKYE